MVTNAQTVRGNGAARLKPPLLIDIVGFLSFFVFGSLTSLNDVLMPKLKQLFALSYGEMTLVQFCFFTSYALVSLPAARLVSRAGYLRALAGGFLLMALGCALFAPAAWTGQFPAFLGALFVLAAGVTIVQVTANPLIIYLGTPASTPARLTFAHACNSIGTVVAPYVGAILILGATVQAAPNASAAAHAVAAASISRTYLGIAVAVACVAVFVWVLRGRLTRTETVDGTTRHMFELLWQRRILFGVAAIGLYVGAEVAIGSLLVNYLEEPTALALAPQTAGKYLAFYWGGLLVGRLLGLGLLRLVRPAQMIMLYAGAALALVLVSISSHGLVAGWSLLAVGLCNSVMFPLIFALTTEGLNERAPDASGLLCVAIVGGALVPLLAGHVADATSLAAAFLVPAACYVGIIGFGWFARENRAPVHRQQTRE